MQHPRPVVGGTAVVWIFVDEQGHVYWQITDPLKSVYEVVDLVGSLAQLTVTGLRAVITEHMRLARLFAAWVEADPSFAVVAPVPFSVVCFRATPAGMRAADADTLNERLLDAINATGEVFLSHTRLHGRFVLRLAVGHLRTSEADVALAWALLRSHLARLVRLDPSDL